MRRRRRAAPSPFLASRTSALVMRPPGPLPAIELRSMPSAAATRAATGETLASSGTAGALGAAASAAAAPLPDGAGFGWAAPGADLHARDDLAHRDRLALLGEDLGDRARRGGGQLHVDLVGRDLDDGLAVLDGVADLDRPLEDRALGDRLAARGGDDVDDLAAGRGLPSPSPSAAVGASGCASLGASASGSSPLAAGSATGASGAAAAAGAAPFSVAISASTAPTLTVSPSAAWILTTVPLAGEGTSASTLSVEISTRVSSASTESPSCLCHSRTVPSVTDSPICGRVTCTVVLTAIALNSDCSALPGRKTLD